MFYVTTAPRLTLELSENILTIPVSESSGQCVLLVLAVKSSMELKLDSELEGDICG